MAFAKLGKFPENSSSMRIFEYNPRGITPKEGNADVHDQWHWIDYFVLRLCGDDFDVHRIYDVIKETGCTMVEASDVSGYLERSFCVFESYASIDGGARLLCNHKYSPYQMKEMLD